MDVPGGGVGCCTFDPLFPVGCGLAAAALATEESESLCLLMLELRDLMVCGRERERERERERVHVNKLLAVYLLLKVFPFLQVKHSSPTYSATAKKKKIIIILHTVHIKLKDYICTFS